MHELVLRSGWSLSTQKTGQRSRDQIRCLRSGAYIRWTRRLRSLRFDQLARSAWTHHLQLSSLPLNWKSNSIKTERDDVSQQVKRSNRSSHTPWGSAANQPIRTKLSIKINLQLYTVSFLYKCKKHSLWHIYILKLFSCHKRGKFWTVC